MKKVNTTNNKRGLFGLFATLALALGVGVSLAPREVIRTRAADTDIVVTLAKMGITGSSYSDKTVTIDEVTFKSSDVSANGTNFQFKASTGQIINTTAIKGVIKSISATQTGTKSFTVSSGTTSGSLTSQGAKTTGSMSWDLSGNNHTFFSIKRSDSGAAYVSSIVVTYTPTPTKSLTSIAVTTQPTKKDYYVGDTFDKSGMAVTAYYDDSTNAVIPNSEVTVTPNIMALGVTSVEVDYQGKKATISGITVEPVPTVTGLTVNNNPIKTTYDAGESFDYTGLEVIANLSNGTSKDVTDLATYSPNPLTFGTTSVGITYEGASASYSPITVNKVNAVNLSFVAGEFNPALTSDKGGSTYAKTVQNNIDFRTIGVRDLSADGNFFMITDSLLYTTSTLGSIKEITINAGAGNPGGGVTGKVYFSSTPFTDALNVPTGTYTNKATTTFTAPAGSQYFAIGGASGNLQFGAIDVLYDLIDYADLTSFEIHGGDASLIVEQTLELSVDVNEEANPAATWVSSNTSVATVSNEGVVTAIAPGKTTITATSSVDSSFTDSIEITVLPILETSIVLSESSLQVKVSKTKQLTATVYPANASNKTVSWSSGDPTKVSVSSSGLVTGLALTSEPVVVTATTVNGFTATAQVTVVEDLIEEGKYTITTTSGYTNLNNNVSAFLNAVSIEKDNSEMGDLYVIAIQDIRIASSRYGIEHENTINFGSGDAIGGSISFILPEGTYATSVKLIGVQTYESVVANVVVGDINQDVKTGQDGNLTPYNNAFTISTVEDQKRVWVDSIEITVKRVENAAAHYANLFLDGTSAECLLGDVKETTWDDLGDIFMGMDNEVIEQFEEVVGNASGSSVEQAVARYTYIGEKYGYYDFMDLGLIQDSTNRTSNKVSNDNLMGVTIIIGVIGLTTLAGYAFLRKKKEA